MKENEYKISELIYKSISKTISEEEKESLEKWLSLAENKILYERIINDDTIAEKIALYKDIDIEKAFHKIEPHIIQKPKILFLNILKYAAVFIGILIPTFFFIQNIDTISNEKLDIVESKILLQVEDEDVKVVNEEGAEEFKDKEGNVFGIQNGNKLIYPGQKTPKEVVFNTLKVPYGKKFELVLSDGTKVHLNAGTSLRYPSNFIEGANREVYLKGEAFFDVAHDKEHPFIVNAEKLDVRVLGTKFNVTAYPEEVKTDVVLVTGSVQLKTQKSIANNAVKSTMLAPGYKGSFTSNTSEIGLEKVNTKFYTSWIHDELIFRDMTFRQIIKRLERNFNVIIKNENDPLNEEIFNASFNKQSIENIMIYFSETHRINYKIVNNEIIIQ